MRRVGWYYRLFGVYVIREMYIERKRRVLAKTERNVDMLSDLDVLLLDLPAGTVQSILPAPVGTVSPFRLPPPPSPNPPRVSIFPTSTSLYSRLFSLLMFTTSTINQFLLPYPPSPEADEARKRFEEVKSIRSLLSKVENPPLYAVRDPGPLPAYLGLSAGEGGLGVVVV
ncbi:hypothetical protein JCM11641_001388 [Rhodosporidiobolus odoratus]